MHRVKEVIFHRGQELVSSLYFDKLEWGGKESEPRVKVEGTSLEEENVVGGLDPLDTDFLQGAIVGDRG